MNQFSPLRAVTADTRIESLRSRHAALDRQVLDEQKRPAPDELALRHLKREKLRIKEQIAACEGVLRTLDRVPANSRSAPGGAN